mmetsp:Transcript_8617/g.13218  ORF Transcript_8617/g.13218 Transcript_8617/m.13218 type:complete len:649 (-) Transcript_8617:338-2284(-)|eukprot:CAMPEP_0113936584 /NCGR_PEP_ID=MMETSP1339-20121228/3464_1 /TAXON_ID=94617 /ORGANISM="Fibrocapsa japonica" /LENGTH=648 /DNA_ID=CAMNT_0000939111 /DNA_START=76 /DNA_END=2022 /DNA_ORIENTATION=+ /assembly_acc=CAM_ASM_000762
MELLIGLLLIFIPFSAAFYLPGVTPRNFATGERVDIKVNKLTSYETQLPFNYYHLPFCEPKGGVKQYAENLGEFLSGDRIENSPYKVYMRTDEFCKVLCQRELSEKDAKKFEHAIKQGYHHNWIVDNLPAASIVDTDKYVTTSYIQGFPVGQQVGDKVYINNHMQLTVDYHPMTKPGDEPSLARVVGFAVEPYSVKHKFMNSAKWDGVDLQELPPLQTCNMREPLTRGQVTEQQAAEKGVILYTYDVQWVQSSTHWASRWDIYLSMNHAVPNKVHWFSIVNSLLIVLFLSMMIGMILVRNLHHDISTYNRVATDEESRGGAVGGLVVDEREETGWKLVHADVFRPPKQASMYFCVLVGTGFQILAMALLTLVFAAVGFLSPANRGSLLIAIVLLYVVLGSSAGYTSAVLYKSFRGKYWRQCILMTAFFFPGVSFLVFFSLNLMVWYEGSTQAVPFFSMAALLVLWFGISVPLVFLGGYFGYRKTPIQFPGTTSSIPRQIPDQPWYLLFAPMIGGILPFGACFVELFFILSSIWMGQYYYVFGFLFLVFIILVITCAEVTMVLTYFHLCAENYHWWWSSFLTAGSTAFYVFIYSAVYFSNLEANLVETYILYFGYMFILCLGLMLMTGCVGFFAGLWLNIKIFSSIKVD